MGNVYKHTLMEIALLNYVGYLKQYSVESISIGIITNVPENKIQDIKDPILFTV